MALSETFEGYLPSRHPRRLARERKRYQHARLTFQAWDTVVRELQERADRLAELDQTAEVTADLVSVCRLIADVRREWQREDT